MKSNKKEVLISLGERYIAEKILAAVFFSVFLYLIFLLIYNFIIFKNVAILFADLYKLIATSGFLIAMGLNFSMVKDILINKDQGFLITSYRVGRFKYNKKSNLPDLDCISIFKNRKEEFETNLWYGKNNHYKMYTFESFDQALDFSNVIASKFNLNILDATQKGNFKWIDNSNL